MLVTLDPRNCNFQQVHSNSSMIIRHSHMRLAIEVSPYTTTNISIQIRFIAEAPWK